MNRLDSLSYYLSYADCIPILNIPSGLLHLICGVRDHIFGIQPQARINEDFKSLTRRKLDDWSHLTKSLAILSIIGNVFFLVKKISEYNDFDYVCGALPEDLIHGVKYQPHVIPKKLLSDKEWLEAAFNVRQGGYFSAIFPRVEEAYRGDKGWILHLIEQGWFSSTDFTYLTKDLKSDREIALKIINQPQKGEWHTGAEVFQYLPDVLKNDPEIVQQAFNAAKQKGTNADAYDKVLRHIDKNNVKETILKCDERVIRTAVQEGLIPDPARI